MKIDFVTCPKCDSTNVVAMEKITYIHPRNLNKLRSKTMTLNVENLLIEPISLCCRDCNWKLSNSNEFNCGNILNNLMYIEDSYYDPQYRYQIKPSFFNPTFRLAVKITSKEEFEKVKHFLNFTNSNITTFDNKDFEHDVIFTYDNLLLNEDKTKYDVINFEQFIKHCISKF